MPSCQEIRECLPFYADSESSAIARPEIEAHLLECPACNREAMAHQNLRTGLQSLKRSQADLAPSPAVWEGASARWNQQDKRRSRLVKARFATAGVCLFSLAFGGAWAWRNSVAEFPTAAVIADYQNLQKNNAPPQLKTPDPDSAAQWLRNQIGAEIAPVNLSLLGGRLEGASTLAQGRFKIGRLAYRTPAGIIALYIAPRQGRFDAPTRQTEGTSFFEPNTHSPVALAGWTRGGVGFGLAGEAESKTLEKFAVAAVKSQSVAE